MSSAVRCVKEAAGLARRIQPANEGSAGRAGKAARHGARQSDREGS
jgi:hypothetical protein